MFILCPRKIAYCSVRKATDQIQTANAQIVIKPDVGRMNIYQTCVAQKACDACHQRTISPDSGKESEPVSENERLFLQVQDFSIKIW